MPYRVQLDGLQILWLFVAIFLVVFAFFLTVGDSFTFYTATIRRVIAHFWKTSYISNFQHDGQAQYIANSRDHIGEAQHLYELWKNNDRAAKNYVPKTYPGRIIHFRPIKEYAKVDTPKARWEKIAAGGVETHRLPVYPAGMLLEPFVKILAEKLNDSLERLNHGR